MRIGSHHWGQPDVGGAGVPSGARAAVPALWAVLCAWEGDVCGLPPRSGANPVSGSLGHELSLGMAKVGQDPRAAVSFAAMLLWLVELAPTVRKVRGVAIYTKPPDINFFQKNNSKLIVRLHFILGTLAGPKPIMSRG